MNEELRCNISDKHPSNCDCKVHSEDKQEISTTGYAIVDKRNGDVWNISTDHTLLEAECQEMGENYILDQLVRRIDAEQEIFSTAKEYCEKGREVERERIKEQVIEIIEDQIQSFDEDIEKYDEPRLFSAKKSGLRQTKERIKEELLDEVDNCE